MESSRLIRMLLDNDWELVRITGSHHQYKHRGKGRCVTVPHPKKELSIEIVRAVLKNAGLLNRLYS